MGLKCILKFMGKVKPLLLLHGWTQSSEFWKDYISVYAKKFKVYAVDLRGHGRTSPITDDFTIQKTAEDLLAFLNQLNLKKVKAIGLSFGGLTLLELTSAHPKRIESMILVGVSQNYNGSENNEIGDTFSYENLPESFIGELRKIHHHGDGQIKALFDENLNYQIHLSDEDLKTIHSETLIIQGDRDEILGIDPAIKLHQNLSNSELWVVPNAGHLAITGPNREVFLLKSLQFLTQKE